MRARWRMAAVVVALAIGLAACGDSGDSGDDDGEAGDIGNNASELEASSPAETAYVAAVNARCTELEDAVFPVTGGGEPTLEEFREDQPELDRLIQEFDADIAKIPVPEAERSTAAAFAAFQKLSDDTYAALVAAAETGDPAKFQEAFGEFLEAFNRSEVDEQLEATGILCPAR